MAVGESSETGDALAPGTFEDLIGYSKLQELLAQLFAAQRRSDTNLSKLQEATTNMVSSELIGGLINESITNEMAALESRFVERFGDLEIRLGALESEQVPALDSRLNDVENQLGGVESILGTTNITVGDIAERLQGLEALIGGGNLTLEDIIAKLEALEAQVSSWTDQLTAEPGLGDFEDRIQKAFDQREKKTLSPLNESCVALQASCTNLEQRVEALEHRGDSFGGQSTSGTAAVADDIARGKVQKNDHDGSNTGASGEVQSSYKQHDFDILARRVADMFDRVDAISEQYRASEKTVGSLANNVEALQRHTNTFANALDDRMTHLKEELAQLRRQLAQELHDGVGTIDRRVSDCLNNLEELRMMIENGNNKGADADVAEVVRRVEEDLQAMQTAVKSDIQPKLDNLFEKEASDVRRLALENHQLKLTVNTLVSQKGAAGTARCLSCFDKRSQAHNKMVVGSDGRLYKRRPSSASMENGIRGEPFQQISGGAGAQMHRYLRASQMPNGQLQGRAMPRASRKAFSANSLLDAVTVSSAS